MTMMLSNAFVAKLELGIVELKKSNAASILKLDIVLKKNQIELGQA